jgi:hypothetical protein
MKDRDWVESSCLDIIAFADRCDWIQVWENKTYHSPSELDSKGVASVRSVPTEDDDELEWEVSLLFGMGTNMESPDTSTCFCFSNGSPSV